MVKSFLISQLHLLAYLNKLQINNYGNNGYKMILSNIIVIILIIKKIIWS